MLQLLAYDKSRKTKRGKKMTHSTRMQRVLVATVLTALFATPAVQASLVGTDVTVTFKETGFSDVVDVVTVGAGNELQFGDGSAIDSADILLDGEFIDISEPNPGMPQIVYNVRGDGDPHSPGFQTTGFGADARYVFSGLDVMPGNIGDVDIMLDNVIDNTDGSDRNQSYRCVRHRRLRLRHHGTLDCPRSGGDYPRN